MLQMNDVFPKVQNAIVNSCGLDEKDVALDKTLIGQLEIDSIDLMDLIFSLEKEYGISIEINEFQNIAKQEMGDNDFAIGNVITNEGLEVLKRLMPEVPSSEFKEGLTIHKIPYLFRVESLCRLVLNKVNARQ